MGALFDRPFERRSELQHRQQYHQQLLDSARFGQAATEALASDRPDPSAYGAAGRPSGFFARVLSALAVVFFVMTIPLAVLSAAGALPVGAALMSSVRVITRQPGDCYAGFYRSAFSGIFAALTVTMLCGVIYAVVRAPHTDAGIVADFGAVLSPHALGLARGALILIPGLCACAGIWSAKIGRPFAGCKGYLLAFALAVICVPVSLGAFAWTMIRFLG